MTDAPRPLVATRPQIITAALGATAVIRGSSLLFRPVDTVSLLITTKLVPIQAWGWAFLAVASLLLAAVIAPPLRFPAHVAAFVVYLLYTLSLAAAAVWFGAPWSSTGTLCAITALHVALMQAYAPRPPGGVDDA